MHMKHNGKVRFNTFRIRRAGPSKAAHLFAPWKMPAMHSGRAPTEWTAGRMLILGLSTGNNRVHPRIRRSCGKHGSEFIQIGY